MKLIKTYIPMFLSILFMFIIGLSIRVSFISETANMKELVDILNILFVGSIIVISIIVIEVILYIKHAVKHKEIDSNILCSLLILLFNVIFIPLYNLKYVVKNKKIKLHMIIFTIISILSIIGGYYTIDNIDNKYGHYSLKYDNTKKYIVEDKVIIKLPITYKEENNDAWDMYYYDQRGIEIGITILDKKYNITTSEAIDLLVLNINKPKLLETISEEDTMISKRYIGEYDNYRFNYIVTSIKLDNSYILCIVQIVNEDNYENYKEELKEIVNNVKEKKLSK